MKFSTDQQRIIIEIVKKATSHKEGANPRILLFEDLVRTVAPYECFMKIDYPLEEIKWIVYNKLSDDEDQFFIYWTIELLNIIQLLEKNQFLFTFERDGVDTSRINLIGKLTAEYKVQEDPIAHRGKITNRDLFSKTRSYHEKHFVITHQLVDLVERDFKTDHDEQMEEVQKQIKQNNLNLKFTRIALYVSVLIGVLSIIGLALELSLDNKEVLQGAEQIEISNKSSTDSSQTIIIEEIKKINEVLSEPIKIETILLDSTKTKDN